MRIEPYNHEVQHEPLRDPLNILKCRKEYGHKETIILLLDNLNERGVRIAGKRYVPLYGLFAFFFLLGLAIIAGSVDWTYPMISSMISSILRILFVLLWFFSPLLIYWDCQAAERYLHQDWGMGKLNALLGIFIGPGGLFLQVLYRIRKL